MEQLRQLPTFTCGHIHDSPESAPYHQADGSYFFPSYTAHLCFTLVVSYSHWAAQHVFALLKTQRQPPMQVPALFANYRDLCSGQMAWSRRSPSLISSSPVSQATGV